MKRVRPAAAAFLAALLLTTANAQTPAPPLPPIGQSSMSPMTSVGSSPPLPVQPASMTVTPGATMPAPAPAVLTTPQPPAAPAEPVVDPAIAPVIAATKPPPARTRPADETEEGGLWQMSDRAERDARQSGELIKTPELNAYINKVACATAGEYCGDLRIYVMQRPLMNAFMTPSGYMEVWSGMLLRAEDEAQLAFVLGHEIGHYVERHSLESLRAANARLAAARIVGIALVGMAAAGANPGSAGDIADLTRGLVNVVYLGTLTSLFGFSRENEMEADVSGFTRSTAAGLDPRAGATMWRNLMAETAASDFDAVRKSETRGSLFRTHPLSQERVQALDALAAAAPAAGKTEAAAYRAAIRPHLSTWLRDDLRRKDFGETLFLLDRLSKLGEDLGVLTFFKGEAYRLRRKDGDLALARAAYEAAGAYPDAPAATWRELGYIYARDGQKPAARAAYETYLAKAPAANDRALVEMSLKQVTEEVAP